MAICIFFFCIGDIFNWAVTLALLVLINCIGQRYSNGWEKKLFNKDIFISAFEVAFKVGPVLINEISEKKG